ncbi:hypothetical protein KKC88_00505 [Patescibacteria group bacterium]|nr:hypothetical protein [Patescibacteria group bacterium]MBU1674049.1 hypothetical protein [Patescibacteria group bacterium]MBU1963197.1 hypothetical protein [Patescibacteria group bacterium]
MVKEPGSQQNEIRSIEGRSRKLAYDVEFRNKLRENPGILKKGMEMMNQAIDDYQPEPFEYRPGQMVRYDKETNTWLIEERGYEPVRDENGQFVFDERGAVVTREVTEQPFYLGRATLLAPGETINNPDTGLEVTLLGRSNREGIKGAYRIVNVCNYFKIKMGEDEYFVKESAETLNPGFDEFQNTQAAREALKDIDFVEVVDAQLGYQDGRQSLYVSRWKDLESRGFRVSVGWRQTDDYGKYYQSVENPVDKQEIRRRYQLIEKILRENDLGEDVENNLLYQPQTGQFFLIDVTGKNTEEVGEPVRLNQF